MAIDKIKQLFVRVSVEVSTNEYGSNLTYQTSRLVIDKEHPLIPKAEGSKNVSTLMDAAFKLPNVDAAYAEAIGSPEMPGPGYDAQTKPIQDD